MTARMLPLPQQITANEVRIPIPKDLHGQLARIASQRGMSVGALLEEVAQQIAQQGRHLTSSVVQH